MSQAAPTLSEASPSNRFALAALLLGGAAIGGSPIFVRLSEVGPMATAFWRVALALIPIVIVSLLKKERGPKPQSLSDYGMLVLPGVMLALDLAAWHLSLTMTSVANATLLANLAPVFVTLIAFVFFSARISRVFALGLVLALSGVVILKGGPAAIGNGDLRGDGIAMIAAFFYACYILAIGRLRSRFDTIRIMLWSTACAAVCIFPIGLIYEGHMLPASVYGWSIVFGLAFISHAGGQVAITYALAYLPAAFSSLTLLLQPVVAAILAWALLNEAIGTMQALGGAVVLAGIMVARTSRAPA
ncbi:membrane protein [Rhizobium leguminosarum bv. trifolii WSM1689]|uniref:Threonine/homoserine efflux transporter RhtA n=1 Tax=Rhizobium laguerreae TaxID=1076926 RepID=A0AAJ3A801_9HYPH|nr:MULTISPECIES: DMT family transporter [Rhizobium]AHF82408.1 membrane protein [Rhizobium leguminosarum bv. trifolii WSM1689]MBY3090375.1 DMT family transporter [Rhizobium laguerreae]MBY3096789.1 DMT family transporter [Rhizobium laguerreae]MBY3124695.1 DMT family transporter [Rhizobium laguerreae]MBY3185335.1 DMT family transporter [Rhizobium laguerreae]